MSRPADMSRSEEAWRHGAGRQEVLTFPDLPGARCTGRDPDLWFNDDATDYAKAICAACPVRAACLKWALDNEIRHGVWGGQTDRERWRTLHAQERTVDDDGYVHGTDTGYKRHVRHGQAPCMPCLLAHRSEAARQQRERRARRRAEDTP